MYLQACFQFIDHDAMTKIFSFTVASAAVLNYINQIDLFTDTAAILN